MGVKVFKKVQACFSYCSCVCTRYTHTHAHNIKLTSFDDNSNPNEGDLVVVTMLEGRSPEMGHGDWSGEEEQDIVLGEDGGLFFPLCLKMGPCIAEGSMEILTSFIFSECYRREKFLVS